MTTDLPPLPTDVAELLRSVDAPPRLVAHLALVHQVAEQVVEFCAAEGLAFDHHAVRYGAATHDIGKVVHPEELSGPAGRN
ncbi:hypothetical protein [Kitasatospora sp. NPDC059827]|uniref:hypothetical protein n=1 Tax=Kitasatospora sp. NPDC059827 TaxID=3346964 RepID=UPI0036503711